jgi:hypothetical protein
MVVLPKKKFVWVGIVDVPEDLGLKIQMEVVEDVVKIQITSSALIGSVQQHVFSSISINLMLQKYHQIYSSFLFKFMMKITNYRIKNLVYLDALVISIT